MKSGQVGCKEYRKSMRQTLIFLLLATLGGACSSRTDTEEAHELARWNGKPLKELLDHPYFKHLPKKETIHQDGSKTILFTDQSKFQTDAYCQSLGGCIGLPNYLCQHVVKHKNDLITGIEQLGTCPGATTTSP